MVKRLVRIIVKGGIGNQMFQYAFGYAISKYFKENLVLDISSYRWDKKRNFELGLFNIKASIRKDSLIKGIVNNKYGRHILKKLFIPTGIYQENISSFDETVISTKLRIFDGYWQSYKYFHHIRNEIKEEFTLRKEFVESDAELLAHIKSMNSVSIHLRGGDYLSNIKSNKKHGVLSKEYYSTAINNIKEKMYAPKFFVFSDDVSFAKKTLGIYGDGAIYVHSESDNPDISELLLMSNCKANIIANSSYSWWAAYLSDADYIICPKKWFRDDAVVLDDLFPSQWIQI